MLHKTLLVAGLLALMVSGVGAKDSPIVPLQISIPTSDGLTLAGTWWGQADHAPAVLALHMYGRSRADWEPVAKELARSGMSVLTLDFRGHGESQKQGNRRLDYASMNEREMRGLLIDAASALEWMVKQPGADPNHLGILGASIGANTALLTASQDKRVQTLVLLSPGLDYKGLKTERAMEQYGTRSIFLVASEDDEYSASTVRRLSSLARGRSALKVYSKAGHGTDMLTPEPTLRVQVSGWFKENL